MVEAVMGRGWESDLREGVRAECEICMSKLEIA